MENSPPIVFLGCKVFEGLIEPHLEGDRGASIQFLDYGLHSVPKVLNEAIQEAIDKIEQPSLIVLGYGLCGNGLHDIKAGKHTLIVPKVDDCVAIFMGSRADYLEYFEANPGTYYLTKGWFEVGSDPLSDYEELVEKYDPETADWLMDQQYQNYKRLMFIAHSQEDFETYRPRAHQVADYCSRWGIVYEEHLGSEEFIRRIAATLDDPTTPTSEFIVVPPGGTLLQEMFR
jgi:hypothetical protein